MTLRFDQLQQRRASDSLKWNQYGPDILPLWVADMDFPAPEPVLEALHRRVDHGVFGYAVELPELVDEIAARLDRLQQWSVDPGHIVLLPGMVPALNVAARAFARPEGGVLVNTPVYPPFLTAPGNQGRTLVTAEQRMIEEQRRIRYEIDFDALDRAVSPSTELFIFCNPHNPTGRAFTTPELEGIADFCLRHDLILCSDEIHSDLLLDDNTHKSIAVLSREIAQRTVTLLAPSKTFNIPTLGCSVAIITDPGLRNRFRAACRGIVPEVGALGMHAALAAYRDCGKWLEELLLYLTSNRDFVVRFVEQNLPGVRTTVPEATYLAWLDCRPCPLPATPFKFFLEHARVALNDGARFGPGGEGFVRLNFGCSRATLEEALGRMKGALHDLT